MGNASPPAHLLPEVLHVLWCDIPAQVAVLSTGALPQGAQATVLIGVIAPALHPATNTYSNKVPKALPLLLRLFHSKQILQAQQAANSLHSRAG